VLIPPVVERGVEVAGGRQLPDELDDVDVDRVADDLLDRGELAAELPLALLAVAAAEVAVGLAIIVAIFRVRQRLSVDDLSLMRW